MILPSPVLPGAQRNDFIALLRSIENLTNPPIYGLRTDLTFNNGATADASFWHPDSELIIILVVCDGPLTREALNRALAAYRASIAEYPESDGLTRAAVAVRTRYSDSVDHFSEYDLDPFTSNSQWIVFTVGEKEAA